MKPVISLIGIVLVASLLPAEEPATLPNPPKTLKPYGIAPAGLTPPEIKNAVERMDPTSVLTGQCGPVRMRWTSEDSPKLW